MHEYEIAIKGNDTFYYCDYKDFKSLNDCAKYVANILLPALGQRTIEQFILINIELVN